VPATPAQPLRARYCPVQHDGTATTSVCTVSPRQQSQLLSHHHCHSYCHTTPVITTVPSLLLSLLLFHTMPLFLPTVPPPLAATTVTLSPLDHCHHRYHYPVITVSTVICPLSPLSSVICHLTTVICPQFHCQLSTVISLSTVTTVTIVLSSLSPRSSVHCHHCHLTIVICPQLHCQLSSVISLSTVTCPLSTVISHCHLSTVNCPVHYHAVATRPAMTASTGTTTPYYHVATVT
jgi:hypothetical protein